MAFYGRKAIWNNIPLETYGLQIFNFSESVTDSDTGAGVNVHQEYIYRRSTPYFYGVSQNNPLVFDITIGSENPIYAYDRSVIEKLLFGNMTYGTLQILQEDLQNIYFKCFLQESKTKYIGNIPYAFNIKAVCDAPWGWEFPKTLTKTYTPVMSDRFTFWNTSDNNDYLYPKLTMDVTYNTTITITNITDNGRVTQFASPVPTGSLYVDNDLQVITSNGLKYDFTKFINKKWFRLVPGSNDITIAGGISRFDMTYSFARKVGG